MIRYYFTKHFTKGLLKGISIEDSITFPDEKMFQEWVSGVNSKNIDYSVSLE